MLQTIEIVKAPKGAMDPVNFQNIPLGMVYKIQNGSVLLRLRGDAALVITNTESISPMLSALTMAAGHKHQLAVEFMGFITSVVVQ